MDSARTLEQRRADTIDHLERDDDVWVATAGPDAPHLVPLSLGWDGHAVIVTTPANSRTVANLTASPAARLALGATRDVVMIDATATEITPVGDAASTVSEAFVTRTGWDPAEESGDWVYVRFTPGRIQAWRQSNEIAGRTVMRDGEWLA